MNKLLMIPNIIDKNQPSYILLLSHFNKRFGFIIRVPCCQLILGFWDSYNDQHWQQHDLYKGTQVIGSWEMQL